MAKLKKEQTFAEMLKELSKERVSENRVENEIEERKYYLIVCEGEKTEPNYFEAFQKHLPPKVQTIKIVGEGANTVSVVKSAIALKEKREKQKSVPNFDEVWAVFDRDSFPKKRVNSAINLANKNSICTGFSNEAFELWYVLHFQYLDTQITRNQYIEVLDKILLKKKGIKYQKNAVDMYDFLDKYGNQRLAIKRAKKLCNKFGNLAPADMKPSTSIYELVESLNVYLKK